MDSAATDQDSQNTDSTKSDWLESLLQLATHELYRSNAFRMTALPVHASSRDISRQADKIKMAQSLGLAAQSQRAIFALDPPPDGDALREAVQHLGNPEQRLFHELFWLWPLDERVGQPDPALTLLAQGELAQAEKLWRAIDTKSPAFPAALHNLAVFHHLQALDEEHKAIADESDSENAEAGPQWEAALAAWEGVLDREGVWDRLTTRMRALEDPRVTVNTIRRIRKTLPLALVMINARLAVRCAQAGLIGRAVRHRRLIECWRKPPEGRAGLPRSVVNEAVRRAVASVQKRITALCSAADSSADADPVHADQAASTLLADANQLLVVLDATVPEGCMHGEVAHDEVAKAALSCQISYGNKTQDWKTSARILREAEKVAASDQVRSQIQQNIDIVEKNEKSGAQWCAPGYFQLPGPVLAILDKARSDIDAKQFETAIPAITNLYTGRAGVQLTPEQREIVLTAMACAFNRRGLHVFNDAMQEYNSTPSYVRRKLAERAGAGQIDQMTMLAANMGGSVESWMTIHCMACGRLITERFCRLQINSVKAIICTSCNAEDDRDLDRQKKELRNKIRTAVEDSLLAHDLMPQDPAFKKNLNDLREVTGKLGGVSFPSVNSVRAKHGLPARAEASKPFRAEANPTPTTDGDVPKPTPKKSRVPIALASVLVGLGIVGFLIGSRSSDDGRPTVEKTESPSRNDEDRAKAAAPAPIVLESQRHDMDLGSAPQIGGTNPKLTLVWFADFQCPFSARAKDALEALQHRYGQDLRIAFRHFPLPFHTNAFPAALAAVAAGEQGQFWLMHDVLFDNQKSLGQDDLVRYARRIGLDMRKFKAALNSAKTKAVVRADIKMAKGLGITGTPSFLLNGRKFSGAHPLASFEAVFDEELKRVDATAGGIPGKRAPSPRAKSDSHGTDSKPRAGVDGTRTLPDLSGGRADRPGSSSKSERKATTGSKLKNLAKPADHGLITEF